MLYFAFVMTDTHQTIGIFFDLNGFFSAAISLFFVFLTFLSFASKSKITVNGNSFFASTLFVIYLLFNFLIDSNIGIAKLITLASVLFILCMNKNIFCNDKGLVNNLLEWIIVLSVLKVIIFLLFVDINILHLLANPSKGRFLYSYFLNPIYLARSCGLAILALIFLQRNRLNRVSLLLFIILFLGLYIAGSRGPVMALLGVFYAKFIFGPYKNKSVITIVMVVFTGFIAVAFSNEIYGFFVREDTSIESSLAVRFELLIIAKDMFIKNIFFGEGLGSFSNHSYLGYPHNLIMEVLSELGLIGGFYLLLISIAGVKLPKDDVFFLMFVFIFLNANFSGNFSNNVGILIVVFFGHYLKGKRVNN